MKKTVPTLAILTFLLAGSATAACVKVPEANLRKSPGTQHEKSWEVYKYMPLKPIGQNGDWYQVEDVDGDTHWIFSRLLTTDIKCAAAKVDKLNVRSGPGADHARTPLAQVDKYYAFKVISEQGAWVEVEDEVQNRGWVSKSLIWQQ